MIETIVPEHGLKEHIIAEEGGINGIVVACGYIHFNREDEEQEVREYESLEDVPAHSLCIGCERRYEENAY